MNEANFKKEAQMSLAQVAYTISTDADFAAKWNEDPQTALAGTHHQGCQRGNG